METCVHKLMAAQERIANGESAPRFREAGCFACPGRRDDCRWYTPLSWVYDGPAALPDAVRRALEAMGTGW